MSIADEDMDKLKKQVLKEQYNYLVQTLGDPSRYMPYMIAADILDFSDKQTVRSKVTSREKAETFIDILLREREEASAFDEFVQALLEERVQSHIARRLQQALNFKKQETFSPPAAQANAIDEELISSVASYPFTNSYHSINEEVTPCIDLVDGPRPPPPPTESLIDINTMRSNVDLLPPFHPTEANLGSYNTQSAHIHMQETYTLQPELEVLRKENEDLRSELNNLKQKVKTLNDENKRLLNENTGLRTKTNS